jgi:hypothetical protein
VDGRSSARAFDTTTDRQRSVAVAEGRSERRTTGGELSIHKSAAARAPSGASDCSVVATCSTTSRGCCSSAAGDVDDDLIARDLRRPGVTDAVLR